MSAPKPGLPQRRSMRHDRHFVDELTQRMGEGIGRMIPIESISSSTDQPRSSLGDLDDLVQSVRTHGVLEPLLVRRRSDGRYELISGERRFHAALQAELEEVPCIELEATDQQALEIALVENLQRQDLSPFEEADGFSTLIHKYGYTHEQVAAAVGRSRVTVTEALTLLAIPADVRTLCRHADITAKGVLLEIAKAPTPESMVALVQQIVEEHLDRASLRERRHQLQDEAIEGQPEGSSRSPRARPHIWRFRHPDRLFSVSLSFRTENEPNPVDVIAALEEMIASLREEIASTGSPDSLHEE